MAQAHDLKQAIKNIQSTLTNMPWGKLSKTDHGKNSSPYAMALEIGNQTSEFKFGSKKVVQLIDVILNVKGTHSDVASVPSKLDAINDALAADRRRGGYAQTTVIGEWEIDEEQGREGVIATLACEIHVYS